jgi:hypothetical protein
MASSGISLPHVSQSFICLANVSGHRRATRRGARVRCAAWFDVYVSFLLDSQKARGVMI